MEQHANEAAVGYMERTRLYYRALGYDSDYVWATFADVPFARLQKPLAQSTIALLTTASPPDRGNVDGSGVRRVWSGLVADPPERPFTDNVAWDKESTHTRDRGSYLPIEVATELAGEGVFSGFALGTPSYEGLDAVWHVLHSVEAFTLIHPGHSDDKRLESFYLTNLLGNPYETGLAAASLVFADVPGRFPGIRFCLCHGGGVTAALAGRWQRGIDTARPGIDPPSLPVADALRRFYVDDLVHDDAVLELLGSIFGADRVLAGSDWPFPMGSDSVSAARAVAAGELTAPLAKEVVAP